MGFFKAQLAVYQERGKRPEVMSENNIGSDEGGLEVYEIVSCVYLIAVGVTGIPLNSIALMKAIKVG